MDTVGTVVKLPNSASGRWFPPGRPATLGDHVIPGGLIYIGRHLRSASGGVEPALINPDLPVAPPGGRSIAPGAGPGLAYHLLPPVTRRTYLDWLAGGRGADVAPGLVLLFCFGLERRMLVDADHDPAVRRELPTIAAEVRRLHARYGEAGRTLRDALDRLLDLLELLTATRDVPVGRVGPRVGSGAPAAVLESVPGRTTTMGVRVALARFAAASAPVPADWARVWVQHHPTLHPRSAQTACPEEFDRLFALRYRDRHGAGLVPARDLPGIRLRYQPASPGLATTLVCREDLPDVLAERRSTRALGALLDSVAAALDSYRRWLAGFPQGRGSLAAATVLPPELVDAGHGQLGALRVWAERQLDGRPRVTVDAGDFWAFWSTSAPDRMTRAEAAAFLTVLALIDFGVEPDARFGAPPLAPGAAVLFRLGRPASERPSRRFPAAAAVARCAAAVASASGAVDPREPVGAAVLGTSGDLAAALRVAPGEDLRLAARLGWLLTTRIDVDRLGRQTASLTPAEREIAGHYLVTVALAADPAIGPATVAVLTRVYRILGLEPDLVFHRLHERGVGAAPALPGLLPVACVDEAVTTDVRTRADESSGAGERDQLVVVQAAAPVANGYALPWAVAVPPPTVPPAVDGAPPGGVLLDQATITRKIAESSAAATLLTAIFESDPPYDAGQALGGAPSATAPPDAAREPVAGAPATPLEADDVDRIAGLDPAHSALLRALAARPCRTREEFASLAAAHGVLPDGAFDLLNEVAIDVVGGPLFQDDDTLAMDNEVLMELLR
ncbi:TerB N-terminal domain-containing protein [Micromonospora fulviviridis]|uniref:TerB N-terminal domain-containing protein n=1 Tax=Micromonospora fulviviridis TaxID=47860 RepID=A0ABV2VU34_9ACTN